MIVIVAASVLLSFEPGGRFSLNVGSMAIAAACLCWGVDNVATRPLALRDPRQIACVKGLAAGSANVAIGLAWGGHLPGRTRLAAAFVVGFLGYGLSLILYIRAMRWLGAARTAAYYSAAPFAGSAIALIWLRERVGPLYWPALVLMVIGLAVHLTEDHRHRHRHEPILHAHRHDHLDGHHRHGQTGAREDAGEHVHEPTVHDHNHTPDDHHRHDHPARADRPGRADHPGRADDGDG